MAAQSFGACGVNYWIALSIMLGWFPVFQTVLHLEQRERDMSRRKGKQNRPVIRDRNNNRMAFTTETPFRPIRPANLCRHGKDAGQTCYPCDVPVMTDDEWLAMEAWDTFCE